MISISLVLYHTPKEQVQALLESIEKIQLPWQLSVVDHSETASAEAFFKREHTEYHFCNGENAGYGAGHNKVLARNLNLHPYHLVLNPDISFAEGTVEKLIQFCEQHDDVGMVSPKILYPNGEVQHLCKLLPSPADLFLRRFLRFRSVLEKRNECYEMRFTGYDKPMQVPHITGCFMLMKREALKQAGLFDERYFMYLEDVDLSRRINEISRAFFVPDAQVTHRYKKESYQSAKLLRYHLVSAMHYFNKWGWLFDEKRDALNRSVLKELQKEEKRGGQQSAPFSSKVR